MSHSSRSLCFVSALVAAVSPAIADVFEFQAAKIHLYQQTTSSPVASPSSYIMNPYIDMLGGDATSVTIDGTPLLEDFPGQWEFQFNYPSQSDLDTAFPGFVFNLHIEGGALGARDESVTLTSPAIYPAPASLTPTSFNDTQSADSSQDLLLQWNAADADTNAIFLSIYDPANDIDIFDGDLPASQTSYLIDASMLAPGQEYEVEIAFANINVFDGQPAPGFDTNANGISGYASLTLVNFTTALAGCVDIEESGIVKEITYAQTADNTQPTTELLYRFDAYMDSFDGAIGSANITNGINTIPFIEDEPGIWEADQTSVEFGSKAALDANFPSSMPYTLHVQDGALGTRDQVVVFGADDYPAIPYLIGTGYSDLTNMNPTQELVLNWSPPSPNTTHVFFEILNTETDSKIFEAFLTPATNFITIPADALEPGVLYEMDINLVAAPINFADDCPGFGLGSINIAGFVSSTAIFFTPAAPCPADLTGDGNLNFGDVSAFLVAYGNQDPIADFFPDGNFNFTDVSIFLSEYGAGCP